VPISFLSIPGYIVKPNRPSLFMLVCETTQYSATCDVIYRSFLCFKWIHKRKYRKVRVRTFVHKVTQEKRYRYKNIGFVWM